MSPSPDHSATGSLLCGEDAGEAIYDHSHPPSPSTFWPPSDEAFIAELIDSENRHMPEPGYLQRCRNRRVDIIARLDSINWILKVQGFYKFQPVTAFLSINYMDRFLSRTSFPGQRSSGGWAFQLLSVACLSVAAKMEEPEVPLLLDLQICEPRFVFEPKTIQRMELQLMSILNWRLRSVTPFDYLHHFFNNLPSSSSSSSQPQSMHLLFSTASNLILATAHVIDFLEFAPSTVAAAAVLCSAGSAQSPLSFHRRLNNEMVRRCHQLMEEYVVDTCLASNHKATRFEPPPPTQSPVGVLDAATCVSCDTRSDQNYLGSTAQQLQAEAEEAEPANKRLRTSAPDIHQP